MSILERTTLAAGLMALALCPGLPLGAEEPEAGTENAAELPAELLAARTVCVMDMAVMDPDLKSRFRAELEAWERFEIVMFPDEADVLVALSARSDFTSVAVDDECDPDDPLCGRASGTAQVFETLYLKIFVPGGDDLWLDEETVGEDDAAAKALVDRLRSRIEASEAGDAAEDGP